MDSRRRYNRTQLEPHLDVSVLYTDSRPTSFDIHYFSSVVTNANGTVQNLGERSQWYGTSRFTDEHLISPFMMKYIRKRLHGLPAVEDEFISSALADYERRHSAEYAQLEQQTAQ